MIIKMLQNAKSTIEATDTNNIHKFNEAIGEKAPT